MSLKVANPKKWPRVGSLDKSVLDILHSFTKIDDRIYLVIYGSDDSDAEDTTSSTSCFVLGSDPYSYLGLGEDVTEVNEPTLLEELENKQFVKIIAGGNPGTNRTFIVALDTVGNVCLWGCNLEGQVNPEETDDCVYTPFFLLENNQVKDVAVGKAHVLALKEDGEINAWGWNGHGQLGQGNSSRSDQVLTVHLNKQRPPAKAIAAAGDRSMALTYNNEVFIWGSGGFGSKPIEIKTDILINEIGMAYTGITEVCFFLNNNNKVFASLDIDEQSSSKFVQIALQPFLRLICVF